MKFFMAIFAFQVKIFYSKSMILNVFGKVNKVTPLFWLFKRLFWSCEGQKDHFYRKNKGFTLSSFPQKSAWKGQYITFLVDFWSMCFFNKSSAAPRFSYSYGNESGAAFHPLSLIETSLSCKMTCKTSMTTLSWATWKWCSPIRWSTTCESSKSAECDCFKN